MPKNGDTKVQTNFKYKKNKSFFIKGPLIHLIFILMTNSQKGEEVKSQKASTNANYISCDDATTSTTRSKQLYLKMRHTPIEVISKCT